jgi:hypothetical protein
MDNEHMGYRIFLFMVWASSCFLSVLQIFWAYLIINGIIGFVGKKEGKKDRIQ